MNNSHAPEEAKRSRVMGDIPVELINEVMSTITDPAGMLGPEVSRLNQARSWEGPSGLPAILAVRDEAGVLRIHCWSPVT